MPMELPYRPVRLTERPTVAGSQTAVVVGPAGEEIFTDKYGRVKVQFHWIVLKNDAGSSCWIRVATIWAGQKWGVIHIPRIGQEEWSSISSKGDPDQPIIVGSVNATTPPWELPANKTQSGIQSRSSMGASPANHNQIRFEDKKGSEQLHIHAEKNQDIEVENDETHWVGHDRTKTIDHDETVHVKHDRTETVDNNETITIGVDRTETVKNNESITVVKNETISIGANGTETVGANESISIGANRTRLVVLLKQLPSPLHRPSPSCCPCCHGRASRAQAITIGAGQVTIVASNDSSTDKGRNRSESIAKDQSSEVGGNRSATVGKDDTLSVERTLPSPLQIPSLSRQVMPVSP